MTPFAHLFAFCEVPSPCYYLELQTTCFFKFLFWFLPSFFLSSQSKYRANWTVINLDKWWRIWFQLIFLFVRLIWTNSFIFIVLSSIELFIEHLLHIRCHARKTSSQQKIHKFVHMEPIFLWPQRTTKQICKEIISQGNKWLGEN